jgi:hypothetical protein
VSAIPNIPVQTSIPSGTTPASSTPSDIDPAPLLSTDFSDFTVSYCSSDAVWDYADLPQPMDLGGWFDGLDYTGPELWDWDADLSGNLPTFS